MFERHIQALLLDELQHNPAVALLGPRQVGKTTLALEAARFRPSVYLDLESERDRAKLAQPELYLAGTWTSWSSWTRCIARPSYSPCCAG
jgi:predicted AAA+ superfamily ATPase